MNTPIDHPPAPNRDHRSAPLDPTPAPSKVPAMSVDAQLRTQDWTALSAARTRYAFTLTGKRSWEIAEDFAQQAITDVLRFPEDGWDAEREPLFKHLCRRVRGIRAKSRRLKVNTFEVLMRAALRPSEGYEGSPGIDAPSGADPVDEVLHRRRLGATYEKRLDDRLAGDEPAMAVVALHLEGVHTPEEQAGAAGLTEAQILDARRCAYRHEKNVSEELARELDSDEEENEVAS